VLAQSVEREAVNLEVAGSIPAYSVLFSKNTTFTCIFVSIFIVICIRQLYQLADNVDIVYIVSFRDMLFHTFYVKKCYIGYMYTNSPQLFVPNKSDNAHFDLR
jgi:hypothetical protein